MEQDVCNEKSTEFLQCFFAPAGVELLNLWNDFRKVVQFIDENQTWLSPLMDRVASNKKAEEK
jgi:hypothetical protein